MLSLFMMPLLIFCVTAENQIEPRVSPPFKVRLILLRYERVATINYFLCNYGLNTITSCITDHVKCIAVYAFNDRTNHESRKQLDNRSIISIVFL